MGVDSCSQSTPKEQVDRLIVESEDSVSQPDLANRDDEQSDSGVLHSLQDQPSDISRGDVVKSEHDPWEDSVTSANMTEIRCIQSLRSDSAYRIQCQVGGNSVEAVVDSGADITILSETVANELSFMPPVVANLTVSTAGEGKQFSARKVGPVEIKFGEYIISTYIFIGAIGDSMLLGLDILDKMAAKIDLSAKTLSWEGGSVPLFTDRERMPQVAQCQADGSCACKKDELVDSNSHGDRGKQTSAEILLCRRLTIPPRSQVVARVTLNERPRSEFMWFQPHSHMKVCVANSVHKNSKTTSLNFINPGSTFITLKKHMPLGVMHSLNRDDIVAQPIMSEEVERDSLYSDGCDEPKVRQTKVVEELPEKLKEMFKDSCTYLTSVDDQIKLKSLLIQYHDVFADHDFDLGNFTAIKHKIDTGDNSPVALPLRRCPIHFVKEEEQHLKEMLDNKIISPSQSEWAAAPVLLRKKDNKIRYCLDFRRLNAVTKKDVFPLPHMGECIDALDGNQWFSKLDANSAYYQVEIDENDRGKTAFRTKHGLFQFNRMPFGLVNAPSTFARAMSLVMAGLTWSVILAYLDDICVLGRSTKEHLENLEAVFKRFRKFGLKFKPRKCELFRKEIEFLGRSVSTNGTTLTDHSIDTIRQWTVPHSTKSLQRLLGMANFHRDYIRDFAVVTEPLYSVLRCKKFFWGSKQQKAFEELKGLLISPAVLAIPSPGKQFFLETDSSDYASGAVLKQLQEGVERVIAYGSFSLTRTQRRYCTTKRELLAVVRFCHHWQHYLLGVEVVCRSDHRALTWLTNFRNIQGQLARWMEELSRYNLVIQYTPGKELVQADALSRLNGRTCPVQTEVSDLPCGGCKTCQRLEEKWRSFVDRVDDVKELSKSSVKQANVVPDLKVTLNNKTLVATGLTVYVRQVRLLSPQECEAAVGSSEHVRNEQSKDPDLQFILEWLTEGKKHDEAEVKLAAAGKRFYYVNREFFFLIDKVLYMKGEGEDDVLVVPRSLHEEVLHLCHDVVSAAHQGIARTKERIRHSFYWYGMSRDIKKFVNGCAVCNQNKAAHKKNKFPLVQNHAGLPLEKIHVDFIGPLPESTSGNQHILVLIDQFTKWLEIVPLKTQKAEVTARAVVDHFIARFGCAVQLITDQGTNFESALFKEMCKLLGIHKSRTTSWRPSANGQVERHNLTIKNAIRCYVSKHQRDWDVNLPLIASAIRASVNRSTGFTPNRLMLGREISIPTDLVFPDHRARQSHVEFVDKLQEGLHQAHECARKTLGAQLKKSKKFYDIGARVVDFKVGDVVYYLNKLRKSKLSPVWLGPCLIIHQSSPFNFDILMDNRIEKRVNHDLLKVCTDRTIPKWIKIRQEVIKKGTEVTYCLCGKGDDGRVMIQCDECLEWYHHHCLSISQNQARQLGDFICPKCRL